MPRLLILSDLHLEFGQPYTPPDAPSDLVVLAGDTAPGLNGVKWAAKTWPTTPVVMIFGNHEFYGQTHPRLFEKARAIAPAHVHILEQGTYETPHIRVLGATLWSDFTLGGPDGRTEAQTRMNDYKRIRCMPSYRKMSVAYTSALHKSTKRWLATELVKPSLGPTVVVSHHAPSAQGLGPRHGDTLDGAYASSLDDFVASSGASLWIHGHTHWAGSYTCGPTKVLSNARGYPDEPTPGFDPGLRITV